MSTTRTHALLAPWTPSGDDVWDRRKVVHLLRRAAFGGSPTDWDECHKRGLQGTLRWLFDGPRDTPDFNTLLARVGGELLDLGQWDDLRAWWLYRMLHSPAPLVEKMTLFWHGHFATAGGKVGSTELMQKQNDTLRKHALGRFRAMLRDISRDPAMLIWLDNRQNVKARPNENYGRELLELFSLGIGHYTEDDIKNAARAFTGWHLKGNTFFFNAGQHDAGDKTFLGSTGRFGGDEIIDVILESRHSAAFLARKLLTFFLYESPEPDLVEACAELLRRSDYDVAAMLRVLFASRVFFSPKAYKALIKSPVELCVGAALATQGRISTRALGHHAGLMGQSLYAPPSVKGWDGGRDWINPSRLIARWNFAMAVSSARGPAFGSHIAPERAAERLGQKSAEDVVDYYLWNLVQTDVSADTRARLLDYMERWDRQPRKKFVVTPQTLDSKVRGLIHVIMTLPEYQLS